MMTINVNTKWLALFLPAIVCTSVFGQTTVNITVTPNSPYVNNVEVVLGDAAPGYGASSLASNATVVGAKTDIKFTPDALFGREVTLGEIASMSYWTKKGETHAVNAADWYLAIYTEPYIGDVSTPTWYGDRIGCEPYFSYNIDDPANTWNEWSTDGAENQLRFFESTQGAPGANFGTYTDPDWSTFVGGDALSGDPYLEHDLLYLSVQTGSAWANGFTGQLGGLRIELTDGSVATINFGEESQVIVDGATLDLVDYTESLTVTAGIINSLNSKLENALDAYVPGALGSAKTVVNKLNGYINAVNAQRGKKLTNEDADYLIGEAEYIQVLVTILP